MESFEDILAEELSSDEAFRGEPVSVELMSRAEASAVCDLVNRVCAGTWNFAPLSPTWRGKLKGETCDRDCIFVGKRGGKIVSVAYGALIETAFLLRSVSTRYPVVKRACRAEEAERLDTLPPLLACVAHLKARGADRVVVEHWHDRPYFGLLRAIERAGYRWEHKSVYLRNILGDLERFEPPNGYRIRTFRPGDEKTWAWLRGAIFGHTPAPEEFWAQRYLGISMAHDFDPEAFLFMEHEGTAVGMSGGVIATQRPKVMDAPVGVIAWTGVLESHRGKGLGKALLSAALQRVQSQGARVCEVETQIYRTVAVRMYQRAGFRFQQASLIIA